MSKFVSITYNTSSSWVAPAGVTQVLVFGAGGGAGGNAGTTGTVGAGAAGGAGGIGNFLMPAILTVTPNTSYTITIGGGGTGGATSAAKGGAGSDTSFGALMTFVGAPGAASTGSPISFSSTSCGVAVSNFVYGIGANIDGVWNIAAQAADPSFDFSWPAYFSYAGLQAAKGTMTLAATNGALGTGGGSGIGIGGAGGNGGLSGFAGTAGASAAANTAAGGGGGGGGGAVSALFGAGGNGGSGQLIVMWVE